MAYKDKARAADHANAYNREKYDRISVMLPKGEREKLKVAAGGKSVNAYIQEAIREKIERERA